MSGLRSLPAPLPGPGKSRAYLLLSGIVWGCIVTTVESLSQPPLDLGLAEYLNFYSRILVHYSAAGILLALLTARAAAQDGRLERWTMVALALVAPMLAALLIDRLSIWYVPWWRNDLMASMVPKLSDLATHMAWIFGVYGGLYVLIFLFLSKEAGTRERLRVSELAKIGTDARMESAMSDDSAPLVAPDLLLRALSELARRYDHNDDRADRLLDKLVQLLRLASSPTRSVRKSRSGHEAELARRADQLNGELATSTTCAAGGQ